MLLNDSRHYTTEHVSLVTASDRLDPSLGYLTLARNRPGGHGVVRECDPAFKLSYQITKC